ncbi:MAG: NifU family protein, partial [Polyangiales bacterium]
MTEAHDDETLRDEGARIETLLDEVAGAVGPATGSRLHELMQRMVGLYGAGLGRVLAHARAAAASEDDLLERLCADELVSSLLLLYEMHPRSPEERIEAALARARPYLGSHGGDVLLLGLDGDVARLRLLGSCDGCPSSAATVERTLERAILDAAPEASRVEVEGLQRPSVPLARLESKPRPKRLRLDGLQVRSRAVRTWESDGARLAIVGTAEQV